MSFFLAVHMTQIMKMSNGDNLCKKLQRTTRFVSAARVRF
ncbi:hypothetical protein ATN83_2269 [Raoultella ornithinolytica]|nr:hypothetical protein ATN83_2269 [Raoultella ornithinolytica]